MLLIPALTFALGLILAISGIGKMRTLRTAADALDALRLPLAAPAGLWIATLSAGELTLAVLLLTSRGAAFAVVAVLTTALFAGFLVVVIRAYRLGSRDACGCFGKADSSQIGPRLILRNVVLLVASVLLLVLSLTAEHASLLALIISAAHGDANPVLSLLGVTLASLTLALSFWPNQSAVDANQAEQEETSELEDTPSPEQILILEPSTFQIKDLVASARSTAHLLVFVKPGCHACEELLDLVEEHKGQLDEIVNITVIITADSKHQIASRAMLPGRPAIEPNIDIGGLTAASLGLGTRRPAAALLGADGKIVKPLARNHVEAAELIDTLLQVASGR